MSLDWNVVLNAAITALVVTLAVEYLAKPRLEARKERILAALRARHELLAGMANLYMSAEFVSIEVPAGPDRQSRETLAAERQRHYGRIQELSQHLADNAGEYARTYIAPVRALVFDYIFLVRGVVLSGSTRRRKAEIIKKLSTPTGMIISHRWWQVPTAVRAWFDVKHLMAVLQADGDRQNSRAVEGAPPGDRRPPFTAPGQRTYGT